MDEFYKEIYNTVIEELDDFINEGVYGAEAKRLLEKRDVMPIDKYMYEGLASIFCESNNSATKATAGMTLRFLDLYTGAIPQHSQELVDTLTAFLKGTEDNPGNENMTSYITFSNADISWKNELRTNGKKGFNKDQKKRFAMRVLDAYSKGVELIGKIFVTLISIEKIKRNQPYNVNQISKLTLFKKMEEFNRITDNKHQILTTVVDRKIRNGYSHLDVTYSIKSEAYLVKELGEQGRKHVVKIKFSEMITTIYPKIIIFIQGFFASGYVTVLKFSNDELLKKSLKNIIDINNGQNVRW